MAHWEALFGSTLQTKSNGEVSNSPTVSVLEDKVVLIYFSAHWCPPCRGFTPQLVKFYNDLKTKRQDFEIVFVSSDKDDAGFNGYYSDMPWTALPFSERQLKSKLSSKFGVNGIPCLVVLNKDGSLISKNGRTCVSEDPTGEKFPWVPLPLKEELGNSFIGKNGPVDSSHFEGKYLGLYFSAHWCPPCRGFTPKLVKYYNERKEKGKNDFEVVFCSSDQSKEQFDEYYAEMPWITLPFKDSRIGALSSRFEVEGIPSLVIMDPDGNVVNKSARGCIDSDPRGERFPYYPEPVEDLSQGVESFGFDVNSKPTLVALMENCGDDDQADAKAVLAKFGERLAKAKAASAEGPEMLFFYAFKPSPMASRIRELCKLSTVESAEDAQLVLLNIPDGGGFYLSDATDVTDDSVGSFIDSFKAGTLTRKQLG